MKSLIKQTLRLSVYHLAKETAVNIEAELKKEDQNDKVLKRKMAWLGLVHSLLGILYND